MSSPRGRIGRGASRAEPPRQDTARAARLAGRAVAGERWSPRWAQRGRVDGLVRLRCRVVRLASGGFGDPALSDKCRSGGCWSVKRSRPFRMGSGPASGTGRRSRRSTGPRSSRPRWLTSSARGGGGLREVGPVRAAAEAHGRLGQVRRGNRPLAAEPAGPRSRRNCSTLPPAECDPILPPRINQTDALTGQAGNRDEAPGRT